MIKKEKEKKREKYIKKNKNEKEKRLKNSGFVDFFLKFVFS